MRRLLLWLGIGLLLFWPLALRAQTPDSHGEVTVATPSYGGETASAPIPAEQHIRNEGGSDRAGLCVISSLIINGTYQEVPGLELGKRSELWRVAKSRPGGYDPEKLKRLLDEVMPGEMYANYYGSDPTVLDALSRQGFPIGVTMGTGQLYGYRTIAHMVSLIHYRIGGMACVVDNNDPGKYHWMPATEFDRRWILGGGTGWAFQWRRLPPAKVAIGLIFAISIAAALFAAGSTYPPRRLRTSTP